MTEIPGYDFGDVDPSPVSLEDLERVKAAVMFDDVDAEALRLAGDVLDDRIDGILDEWEAFLRSHPLLATYFSTLDGVVLDRYLGRVLVRLGQWIRDSCTRPYDQAWLDYQNEIARRHVLTKNVTDDVESVAFVPLRYMIAFIYPMTVSIRPHLAGKGHDDATVEAMYQAWFKSVTLQMALWSQAWAPSTW